MSTLYYIWKKNYYQLIKSQDLDHIYEWLDMSPISSSLTAIDEIFILRKAKGLSSNIRSQFSTYKGRLKQGDYFIYYLENHPFCPDIFRRFLRQIEKVIGNNELNVDDVFNNGLNQSFKMTDLATSNLYG